MPDRFICVNTLNHRDFANLGAQYKARYRIAFGSTFLLIRATLCLRGIFRECQLFRTRAMNFLLRL
jgi:hypothetical protein